VGPEGWTLSIGKESQHLSDNISTEHTAFLKVTKTATGVAVALGDDAFVAVTETPLNQYYTFDTLYFEGPSNGTGFAVDNLRIETNVVPSLRLCFRCSLVRAVYSPGVDEWRAKGGGSRVYLVNGGEALKGMMRSMPVVPVKEKRKAF